VLSRLPKADTLLIALDNLNEKTVSTDNLQALLKNWPGEEFDDLIREADENPETKWDKTEAYFVTLGKKKKFETRIKVWLFKMQFEKVIGIILDSQKTVLNGFKEIKTEEKFLRILGSILKVGNCMNAGNKNRGQADGY
jgi:formin 2